MEKINQCPLCSKTKFSLYTTAIDYSNSKEPFAIEQCDHCTFLLTNPRPTETESSQYYEAENYVSHSGSNKGLINQIYLIVRSFTLKNKVKFLKRFAKGNQLLDVGCGTGDFLYAAKQQGFQVKGIETSPKAKTIAQQKGLEIMDDQQLFALEPKQFDALTLWHVLEHIHQLNDNLKQFNTLLKPKGVAIIAVPNPQSTDATHYQNQWAALDVPRHLYHFTPKTIEQLMTKHHFKLIHKQLMPFDAFYVSLLSEKYKPNNRFETLKGFWNGLVALLWATKNVDKASSIMYVFEKI